MTVLQCDIILHRKIKIKKLENVLHIYMATFNFTQSRKANTSPSQFQPTIFNGSG